jgi:hypothetical protein
MSAMSLSSSSIHASSPGVPFSWCVGARCVAVAKGGRGGLDQLTERLAIGMPPDDGAGRHGDPHVGPVPPVGTASHASPARVRAEVAASLEVAEGREAGIDDEHDAPAGPAVTAVGPAARHVRLAPERAGAVPTGSGGDEDAGAVREHGHER